MQLDLSRNELGRLGRRIQEDYDAAIGDHERRMERFRSYYQRWRNRVDPPARGEEHEPNFSVPLVQWNVAQKWADDMSKLLGADAEIVAKPVGPADQKLAAKVGRYETWRVFQSMRLVNSFATFCFRKTLFGRSHAYAPWLRQTFPVRDPRTRAVTEKLAYEGPGFFPLWPDDLIVPAEDAVSIHDFSYCIRRYRVRVDDLVKGEKQGLYQGISERYEKLVEAARNTEKREAEGEEVKREKDEAEGVVFEGGLSPRGELTVLDWYGWWRKLKGRRDAREENLRDRERYESELVGSYIPDLDLVIGAQDLLDLYPTKRLRRPIVETSLLKDGSYWSPGFGEILESIEDESTVNHRLFTKAGMLAVGPLIFYKPSAGFDPGTFFVAPGMAVPTEDPASVNVVRMTADLQYPILQGQALNRYAERTTGLTDMSGGRASDQPNQPRTARGTLALLEQGNIRANLDTLVLREDMSEVVRHFWTLEQQFPGTEKTFFRVTEEEAKGLFPTSKGGAEMKPEEMLGDYDFDLKFATSAWSREAEKDRAIQVFGLDLQNPLILNNPRALWVATNRLHKALGDDNLGDILPEPADLARPRTPIEEWNLALQGEDLLVHPDDHDELHEREHLGQIQREREDPERADLQAIRAMIEHTKDHRKQASEKLLRQALVQETVKMFAGNLASGQGLQPPGQPTGVNQLQALLGELAGPGGGAPAPPGPGVPAAGQGETPPPVT